MKSGNHLLKAAGVFALLFSAFVFSAPVEASGELKITFLANEGVLMQAAGKTVLIDAFVGEPYSVYGALPDDVLRKMLEREPPFERVDTALVSHVHRDHFQPETALRFLAAHPETEFIAAPEVIAALKAAGKIAFPERVSALLPQPGLGFEVDGGDGLQIDVLRLLHGGERWKNLQNLGYVIRLGERSILHIGDAGDAERIYTLYELAERDIDVALVPYWFLQYDQGKTIYERHLRGKVNIAVHIPPGEYDAVVRELAESFPDVIVFEKSLESRTFFAPRALTGALNAAVASLLRDGSYDDLYLRWFGAIPGSAAHPYPPCPSSDFPPVDDELREILDSGTVRIGFAPLGPPYSEMRDDEPQGWDLDLAAAIGEQIAAAYEVDLRVEHVRLSGAPFPEALFQALDEKESDAILSDLAITDERTRRVDFSCPYLTVTFGLLQRCGSSSAVGDLAAADRPDVEIVVLRRAFLHRLADEHLPNAGKLFVDDPLDIPHALLSNKADAALLPTPSIEAYAEKHSELCAGEFQIGPGAVRGIAVSKKLKP